MSIADSIYRSVRLACCTALLIALANFAPDLYRLWIAYDLTKAELARRIQPGIEAPVFRVKPAPQEKL